MTKTAGTVEVVPTGAALGAEVVGVDLMSLGDAVFQTIRQAILDHQVLRFRDQHLDDPGLVAFGRRFGPLLDPGMSIIGKPYLDDFPEILCISNIKDGQGNPMGNLGSGEAIWHTDQSYEPIPPSYSILNAIELPPMGGDTQFADMYLAYETLPVDLKRAIDDKVLVHDESVNSAGQTRKGFEAVGDPRDAPGARHPAVRVHPDTGRKALYLGRRRNSAVRGIPLAESEVLLDQIWRHATKAEFIWTHEWRPGDVLMWDNASVMHRRDGFDPSARRMMHRVQVVGGVPR